MLHFHPNDFSFVYANDNADADYAYSDADASDVAAYAVAYDANADEQMSNVARRLAGAYAVLLLSPLLPMLMLLWQLL